MRILIIGHGKMGRTIESLAVGDGHVITEIINSSMDKTWWNEIKTQVDVAIEFTDPDAAFRNINDCIVSGIPVVSGTTGWLDQIGEVKSLVKKHNGSFFYASNYSIGVNIIFELNTFLARMMKNYSSYDVRIEETHHTEKRDSPSGTAITLANGILDSSEVKKRWVNEASDALSDLLIESLRMENVPGTHLIKYDSAVDTIEIKHTAHSRQGFAAGALMAANYIRDKKGIFGMKDLLGI